MSYNEKPRWTANQTNFLRENFAKYTDYEIACLLGRTMKSVRRKRQCMELEKKEGRLFANRPRPDFMD